MPGSKMRARVPTKENLTCQRAEFVLPMRLDVSLKRVRSSYEADPRFRFRIHISLCMCVYERAP